MKKVQKTFAERAKAIQKKYTRAEWDAIERKDMLKELRALKDEQEQVRGLMEVADNADQMDQQEQAVMAGGGTFSPNKFNYTMGPLKGGQGDERYNLWAQDVVGRPKGFNYTPGGVDPNSLRGAPVPGTQSNATASSNPVSAVTNSLQNTTGLPWQAAMSANAVQTAQRAFASDPSNVLGLMAAGKGSATATTEPTSRQFQSPGTPMLPFALSAGIGAIGDIAGMINANKGPKSVNLGRMAAQNVDYEPQRQQLRRDVQSAQNVNLRNARDMSSPANAYANMVAGNTQLYDVAGSKLGESYMNEQNTNAQLRQQAAQQNAQLVSQEAQTNLGIDMQRNQQRGQYIDRLAQNIPSAMKDYREQANQQNIINMMGEDMGLYQEILQNPTFMQKLQYMMGTDPRFKLATADPRIPVGSNNKRTQ